MAPTLVAFIKIARNHTSDTHLRDSNINVLHLIEAKEADAVGHGILRLVEHERNTRRDLEALRLEAGSVLGILGEHLNGAIARVWRLGK